MPRSARPARLRTLVACGLAALALAATPAGAAQAQERPDGVHAQKTGVVLRNLKTHSCLDSSNAYGLRAVTCNLSDYQQWTFTVKYKGTWEIRSEKTGRCLDHSASNGLRTFACNGSDYQRWAYALDSGDDREADIRNVVTNDCLDHSNSHGLRAVLCNGTDYQDWNDLTP